MIIKRNSQKYKKIIEEQVIEPADNIEVSFVPNQETENPQEPDVSQEQNPNDEDAISEIEIKSEPVEEEIDLFDLDNIDFKQRHERRSGDRRRGFRRIDDRNLISRAKEEANAIREAAAKEGYDDGLRAAKEDVDSLKDAMQVFFGAEQQVYDAIAPEILAISIDIAKKIIKKESVEDSDLVLKNIKEIMKSLSKDESKITLKVNPTQTALVKQEVPEISESLGLEAKIFVVSDDSIMEGGCILTTTNGVIDASIEAQLSVISEVLKEL